MSRAISRRLLKIEMVQSKKELQILVRHEHLDRAGNIELLELPEGFTSVEEAEAFYSDWEILWVVVQHVPGKSINFDEDVLSESEFNHANI